MSDLIVVCVMGIMITCVFIYGVMGLLGYTL